MHGHGDLLCRCHAHTFYLPCTALPPPPPPPRHTQVLVAERGDLLFVFNFSPFSTYEAYQAAVPRPGKWRVCLDSDAWDYGGQGRVGTRNTHDTISSIVLSCRAAMRRHSAAKSDASACGCSAHDECFTRLLRVGEWTCILVKGSGLPLL